MKINRYITALVPMKGHSERIQNKNMRDFGGKPMCAHILDVLNSSEYVSEILVNTDSQEIAGFTSDNFKKVRVIERPDFLLGDKVSMTPIIKHDLQYASNENIFQTHATNPLLKLETLNSAIRKYFEVIENDYDSVMGVTSYQTRFYSNSGKPLNHNPNIMLPSQDMPPIYEDNSNFYIFSKIGFTESENRVGKKPFFYEVNKLESLDIDEEEDFIIARSVYEHMRKG